MKEMRESQEALSAQEALRLGFQQLQADPSISELHQSKIGYLGDGRAIWIAAGRMEGMRDDKILPFASELLSADPLTVEQAHLTITTRKLIDDLIKAKPEIFEPDGRVYTFSPSSHQEQVTEKGCQAATFSAVCRAIGIDVSEQDVLEAGRTSGFVGDNGAFFPWGIEVLLTPAVEAYIENKRPEVESIEIVQVSGYTLKEITGALSTYQANGEDVYFMAILASEMNPIGYHSVIVESIGPEVTVIHDPSNRIGGVKELPTSIFLRRLAQAGGEGKFICVVKELN